MVSGTVIGNIGRDAELSYTKSNQPLLKFSVASTEKKGQEEVTTWVNVSLWGKRAKSVAQYVTKGSKIAATGSFTLRPYEKDGQTRFSLDLNASDIQLLGSKGDSQSSTVVPVSGVASGSGADSAGLPF